MSLTNNLVALFQVLPRNQWEKSLDSDGSKLGYQTWINRALADKVITQEEGRRYNALPLASLKRIESDVEYGGY